MIKHFIEHKILAWVLAILISMSGIIALHRLPVELFPEIAPPEIVITAKYPGASAEVIDSTVTQPIEQQLTGLEGLSYMTSASDSSGQARITLTFASGTDANTALMQVQNKIQLALGILPEAVRNNGLQAVKTSRNFILIPCFYSENAMLDSEKIADYVASNIVDTVGRLPGVGSITMYGSQYAMRIWLNPDKLENLSITPGDVIEAVTAQNAQVSGGQFGGAPSVPGQELNVVIDAGTRLKTVDDFKNILLRGDDSGAAIRLGDVARIELGAENPAEFIRFNGKPAAGFGIGLAPGANALMTADAVKKELASLERFFPDDLKVVYSYDGTPFILNSIMEVCKTLLEAIFLVSVVMFVFMGNWRATLVPVAMLPVILLGVFIILMAAGYSVNMITLFALVLAIGLLVDDATVLVENTDRIMSECNVAPDLAVLQSMRQISKTLVGITIILIAVFSPLLFFPGATGIIYRQLSVTLISAMSLSLLLTVIFGPVLCSTFLKTRGRNIPAGRAANLAKLCSSLIVRNYSASLKKTISHPVFSLAVYGAFSSLLAIICYFLPSGFLPMEDQARMFATVNLPANASLERTSEILANMERYFMESEAGVIESVLTVAGRGFSVNGQNTGALFIRLKDWSQRNNPEQEIASILGRARANFHGMSNASVSVFAPPAVPELGNASGFDFILQDRGGIGHERLINAKNSFIAAAADSPYLENVRIAGLEDVEQYKLKIDREKALAHGVRIDEINTVLNALWGSTYINDFMDNGRTKKVYLQADAPFRMSPENFSRYHARNDKGGMVPFSAFMTGNYQKGPMRLERYNGIPAIEILGEASSGSGSGTAMNAMEEIAATLPDGLDWAWTGISFQEKMASGQSIWLYLIAIFVVYLCLAALYSSWILPLPVLLIIPAGASGSFIAAWMCHLNNDIYFQIGVLTIIALSARNAIFIIEFAKELVDSGKNRYNAIIQASCERLRPILITSLTFIAGIVPMIFSHGAGAGAQHSLGIVIVGGMLTTSLLVPYFTPLFYMIITGSYYKMNTIGNEIQSV